MMRLEDIAPDVRSRAFEFFYWFSRFEFALKENKFLKNPSPGSRAEPGWDQFIKAHEADYDPSAAGFQLVDEAPQRQIVGQHELEFVPVGFDDQPSELARVVRLLKTVRNNLFHGGKHGVESWDDPERTLLLMSLCIRILDELAELAGIDADYKRYY
ncbi:hypothetical protein [Pacificibacter marinus]|uniref:hypothetical protein n=1 Tax=Pacificibacter marinus TaxID=658057 RepID=UPI001C07D596|nr:hypothetical protein [Pacificibacter marinus]MBU2868077.1 hypothetical protein [Pacificibacter marinus]